MDINQFVILVCSLILFLVLIILILKRSDILSFIYPENWCKIIFLEKDNNVRFWLQKKNKQLNFEFNKGVYQMYETLQGNVYRKGRINCMFYVEGCEFPINLRNINAVTNPQLLSQLKRVALSELFIEDKTPLQHFLEKYAIYIIFGFFVIVVIFIVTNRGGGT